MLCLSRLVRVEEVDLLTIIIKLKFYVKNIFHLNPFNGQFLLINCYMSEDSGFAYGKPHTD